MQIMRMMTPEFLIFTQHALYLAIFLNFCLSTVRNLSTMNILCGFNIYILFYYLL